MVDYKMNEKNLEWKKKNKNEWMNDRKYVGDGRDNHNMSRLQNIN